MSAVVDTAEHVPATSVAGALPPTDAKDQALHPSASRHTLEGVTLANSDQGAKSMQSTDAEANAEEDDTDYPTGAKFVLICVALCSVVFLVGLDQTIVSTAVPRITNEFNSFSDVGFYSSAYLLASTAFQPLFGRFYASFDIKTTFLVSFAIFELGSLLCAVAVNSNMFIAARAIAGLGLAGGYSGVLIIITLIAPLHIRPLLTSMVSGFYGISAVIGPIIGGAITSRADSFADPNSTAASYRGWRWNFFLNLFFLPILVPTIWLFVKTKKRVHKDTPMQRLLKIDWLGSVLALCSILCILLVFQWGGVKYAWSDSRIIGLIIGFVVISIAFVVDQWWMGERATIPFSILQNRTVWGGSIVNFAVGATYFAQLYFLPLYFQSVRGSSAIRSGVQTLPFIVAVIFAVIFTGAQVNQHGYYIPFLIVGTALMTAGGGALYTFDVGTSQARWGGLGFFAGLGPGMIFMLPFIAASAVLAPKDIELGSAIVIFFQTLGGTISTSLAQSIFQNRFQLYLNHIPGASAAQILEHGVSAFRETTPANLLPLISAACNKALQKVWIMVIVLGAVSFLSVFTMDLKGRVDVQSSKAAEKSKKDNKAGKSSAMQSSANSIHQDVEKQ